MRDKKLVLINANCHGKSLKEILELHEQFRENYYIYPVPEIHLNTEKKIDAELLKKADVYIHQDIRADNKIAYALSDEAILPLLKPDCINIVIPNIVGFGKWLYPNLGEIIMDSKQEQNLLYRDFILDEAYEKLGSGGTLSEYVSFFNSYEYRPEYLENLFLHDKMRMELRERNWDVKITKYITDSMQQIPVLVDAGHPSRYVMLEIGRQVLELLGVSYEVMNYWSHMGMPVPIAGQVKKYWEITYQTPKESRKSFIFSNVEDMSEKQYIEEYIIEYLHWVYGVDLIEIKSDISSEKINVSDIRSWKNMSDKHLALFLLMNRWMKVKYHGKSIISYLEKHGYDVVAIYGMSHVGERVVDELRNSTIVILYGIDRDRVESYAGIKMIKPEEIEDNIQAVIVTPITSFYEIEKMLKKKVSCPILSLDEMLYEMEMQ